MVKERLPDAERPIVLLKENEELPLIDSLCSVERDDVRVLPDVLRVRDCDNDGVRLCEVDDVADTSNDPERVAVAEISLVNVPNV